MRNIKSLKGIKAVINSSMKTVNITSVAFADGSWMEIGKDAKAFGGKGTFGIDFTGAVKM